MGRTEAFSGSQNNQPIKLNKYTYTLPDSEGIKIHGVRQDLETGRPKLAIVKFGCHIFHGRHQYTHCITINMYLLIILG